MAEIVTLERLHHDFYAPAFEVLVGGRNLLTKEFAEITTVQVDATLDGMDQFSFTTNSGFDFERREFVTKGGYDPFATLFALGTAVEIKMGYRDRLTTLHQGTISNVKTSFPSSGLPQITVSGYDKSYPMKQGTPHPARGPWDKTKDSQIAAEIAADYNLVPDVEDSQVVHARTEQNQETDLQFLTRLAKRCEFEVYVREDQLYFGKRKGPKSALITLEWGKGLVSFSPEVNLAEQVTEVEVRGWDPGAKDGILGKAGPGDEQGRDPGRRSGGEILRKTNKKAVKIKKRFPVRSKQEADQRARAILKKRSEQLVKGSGESVGLPEIMPNTSIELTGLGRLFSRTYLVKKATHTVGTSGYKTTFNVEEPTR